MKRHHFCHAGHPMHDDRSSLEGRDPFRRMRGQPCADRRGPDHRSAPHGCQHAHGEFDRLPRFRHNHPMHRFDHGHGDYEGRRHGRFANTACCDERAADPFHSREQGGRERGHGATHRRHDHPNRHFANCAGRDGRDGRGGHGQHPDDRASAGRRDDRHGDGRGRGRGGRRLMMHGDLRLLLLALIEEQPRHGYELIRLITDMFHGHYSPSPGVIYPTLTLLEDLGHLQAATNENGRKLYAITDAGKAFADENRQTIDAVMSRSKQRARMVAKAELPAPVRERMHDIKRQMLMRSGQWNDKEAARIASILERALQEIGPTEAAQEDIDD